VKPNAARPARVNRQYSVSAATARTPTAGSSDHDDDDEHHADRACSTPS